MKAIRSSISVLARHDLCGLYGIRRSVDTPIYSIAVAAGIIADIVRIFAIDDRYTVSGPVWEYFSTFARACALRRSDEIDSLLREVRLDLQNGILGKTCVHPTQLPLVQASYTVPYEQYQDALAFLAAIRALSACWQASGRIR